MYNAGLRYTDTLLQHYYSEIINENNDGWTKEHYKKLYSERIKRVLYLNNKISEDLDREILN
jgi:hypothetical protein